MDRIILLVILIALIEAIYKKIDVFEEFMNGVKEGMKLVTILFPTLMAFMVWVTCFQTCGIVVVLEKLFLGIFNFFNIPIEIFLMMIIRPFSSNGSMSVLTNIFNKYGVDHQYGQLASIIQTGSDTTFYVVSLYFGSIKLTNNRYALKLGLWLDAIACLLAIIFYSLFLI